jgi:hypothetical protein
LSIGRTNNPLTLVSVYSVSLFRVVRAYSASTLTVSSRVMRK